MEHREIEIKLKPDAPLARIAARIRTLGATLHRARHFEDNYVLDDPRAGLRRRGFLLRIRLTSSGATVTFKGRRRIVRRTKAREEIETEISDGTLLLKILERVGIRRVFRYQKYRTVYRRGPVLITLDETPIGDYVEVEGSPDGIARFAKRLGFTRDDFITSTYHELFESYKKTHRIRSKDMLFGIKSSG